MNETYFERLSGLDAFFLVMESPTVHAHVGATLIFDGRPLATDEGGIDFEALRRLVASRLHLVPRYRQRLAFTPIEGHPVWVDDPHFNLDYHVRHTALPRPGTEEQLKRLAGRILSQPLDRSRPLWEMWIVEGLTEGRMGLISKVHHCMIDGMAGVDLMETLLSPEPQPITRAPIPLWRPRPLPDDIELIKDAAVHWTGLPLRLGRDLLGLLRGPSRARLGADGGRAGVGALAHELPGWQALKSLLETARLVVKPTTKTPFNRPIGPFRRLDWLTHPLADLKAIKNRLGGTVNDAVLTITTGAVRRYLTRRRIDPTGLDVRVLAPVSVRQPSHAGTLGNHVSAWLVPLPLAEEDPRRQFEILHDHTRRLKASGQAMGAAALAEATNWTGSTILSLALQIAARIRPFNLLVTNVPGPQIDLYLGELKLEASYPQVPLFYDQGLGIALFSYAGRMHWGLTADWDLVPDLDLFRGDLAAAAEELRRAAEEEPAPTRPRRA